ncbi:Alpha N-terminal protein methyltransferase 1 [Pseudolycoriella hygida]|uniref:Alpha N-terminal protein methyltransferase 1 n=1 Tax=Pseudolycoriella hygida TaxID=35572 RepID=A0A9Q0MLD1_9DIPT|nr:Alpha N-terminal protein methyltransferase 1 [Pseudolycoriella hygida]
MNGTTQMEKGIVPQLETTEQIIDEIQNIHLLSESKVSQQTIGSNESLQCILETSQHVLDTDDGAEDENENLTQTRETFYKDAQQYWQTVPATVDGMLGGFSNINFTDIRGSQDFLKEIFKMKPSPNKNIALDCGAGIGRVSKHLLIPIFNTVDIVEQDEHFANSVKEYVGNSAKLGTIFNEGLQEFHPKSARYDVIWCQWVLGHLTNDDFVEFFERCGKALSKHGIIIVKENVTSTENVDIDDVDSSVTRPLGMMKALLAQSGLRIVKMVRQHNFPSGIFPVYMFALRPTKRNL